MLLGIVANLALAEGHVLGATILFRVGIGNHGDCFNVGFPLACSGFDRSCVAPFFFQYG